MSDSHPTPIYYGYWLIGVAFVTQLVAVGVTNYVAGPFMAPMVEELGWSRAEYTIPRSLGMFIMAGVGFLIGALVDRHGGRRFMLFGTCVCSASLWLLGSTETLAGWIVVNGVLLTAGAGLMGNLVVNVTLAKWFVERRGFAVAMAAMGVSFAGIAVTPAVTWAIEAWGWRSAWEALAVASFLVAAPVSLFVRRAPEDHGLLPDGKTAADAAAGRTALAEADFARSMTRRQALGSFAFYALIAAFGLFTINIVVVLLHAMPWLDDEGFTPTLAAQMIVVTSIPAMLAKPIWGFFIDRLQAKALGRPRQRRHRRRLAPDRRGPRLRLPALGNRRLLPLGHRLGRHDPHSGSHLGRLLRPPPLGRRPQRRHALLPTLRRRRPTPRGLLPRHHRRLHRRHDRSSARQPDGSHPHASREATETNRGVTPRGPWGRGHLALARAARARQLRMDGPLEGRHSAFPTRRQARLSHGWTAGLWREGILPSLRADRRVSPSAPPKHRRFFPNERGGGAVVVVGVEA